MISRQNPFRIRCALIVTEGNPKFLACLNSADISTDATIEKNVQDLTDPDSLRYRIMSCLEET